MATIFWLSTYLYLLRIYCGPSTKLNAFLVCASPFNLNYVRETTYKYVLSRLLRDSVKHLSPKGY